MTRRSGMSFSFALDASAHAHLHEQLYHVIRAAILAGKLRPGERLPSMRALALQLNVGRNTVANAFGALASEGYLKTRHGAAAVVTDDLPEEALRLRPSVAQAEVPVSASATASPEISRRGLALLGAPMPFVRGIRGFAFRLGTPALDAFPTTAWERILRRRWSCSSARLLGDVDRCGYAPLREAIADYLSVARGLPTHSDRVIIVAGAQQAFTIVAQLLLDPGDAVWVEDPGYSGSLCAILAAGGVPVPMPVDDRGARLDAALQRAPNARLAVVTPANQFPLGVTMSDALRRDLVAWAPRADAWILEDDYDGEFRYTGTPVPALASLSPERVVYAGTFSKVLSPSLRLGYLVVPDALVDAVAATKAIVANHTAIFEQAVVCDFITSGQFQRHVRRMRVLYGERRESREDAARAELGGVATLRPIQAGIHAILDIDGDADLLASRAATAGIHATPLSAFAVEGRPPDALVLGFAAVPPAEQRRALRALAGLPGAAGGAR